MQSIQNWTYYLLYLTVSSEKRQYSFNPFHFTIHVAVTF